MLDLYEKTIEELRCILIELTAELHGCTLDAASDGIEKFKKDELISEIVWAIEILDK